MKRLIECLTCGRVLPVADTYKVSLEGHKYQNKVTGETEQETLEGRVCPICNDKWYKTSKKKLEKYKLE